MNSRPRFAMTAFDYLLYAGIIWGWSTSWYAMTHQKARWIETVTHSPC